MEERLDEMEMKLAEKLVPAALPPPPPERPGAESTSDGSFNSTQSRLWCGPVQHKLTLTSQHGLARLCSPIPDCLDAPLLPAGLKAALDRGAKGARDDAARAEKEKTVQDFTKFYVREKWPIGYADKRIVTESKRADGHIRLQGMWGAGQADALWNSEWQPTWQQALQHEDQNVRREMLVMQVKKLARALKRKRGPEAADDAYDAELPSSGTQQDGASDGARGRADSVTSTTSFTPDEARKTRSGGGARGTNCAHARAPAGAVRGASGCG
eukprot:scaffold4911_cov90-Isochrysis_galbana.AAC.1